MATNDTVDPTVQEADLRAERAKASLLSRVEVLKHRLSDVKHRFDLQAQITQHPLPAVGIAFALGAALALRRSEVEPAAPGASRSLRSALVTALGAITLHVVRELALGQIGVLARQWWGEHPAGTPGAPDAGDARLAGVEPFLEH
ncbi:MAG TPA: hypothetical protein VFK02_05410 [Kofleriaceae bacterium]|nr:hypothetical protein [Kofleriaceae bacterium]